MPTDNEYLRLIYMTVSKAGGQAVTGSVALDNAILTALADAIATALAGGSGGTSLSSITITALADAIATALGGGGGAGGLGLSSVTITALADAIATALGSGAGGLSLSSATLAALEEISLDPDTISALGSAVAAALGGTAAKSPVTDVGEWFAKSKQVQIVGTSYSGWVVPYGKEWKIQAVYARFQTTNTGDNRVPRLVIIPAFGPLVPSNEILQQPMLSFPTWGQAPDASTYYQWCRGSPGIDNGVVSPALPDFILPTASGIFVNDQLGVSPSGDIWDDVRLFYEERSVDLAGITQW